MKFQLWEIFFRDPKTLDEKLGNVTVTFGCIFLTCLWIFPLAFGLTYGIWWLSLLGLWLMLYTTARFIAGAGKLLA